MNRFVIAAIAAALCLLSGYSHACGSMVQWKGVSVQIACAAFQPEKHRLSYRNGALWTIDGRRFDGAGGAPPKLQVHAIRLKIDGSLYLVPEELLRALYEPMLPPGHRDSLTVQRTGDLVLVRFTGGGGAGAYEVIWVLNAATRQLTRLLYEQPDPGKAKMVRVQLKPAKQNQSHY